MYVHGITETEFPSEYRRHNREKRTMGKTIHNVVLNRRSKEPFGFRIIGGKDEGLSFKVRAKRGKVWSLNFVSTLLLLVPLRSRRWWLAHRRRRRGSRRRTSSSVSRGRSACKDRLKECTFFSQSCLSSSRKFSTANTRR